VGNIVNTKTYKKTIQWKTRQNSQTAAEAVVLEIHKIRPIVHYCSLTFHSEGKEEKMKKTMRAIVMEAPGPPESFQVHEVPFPVVKQGWVRIRVEAFGINRSEYFLRKGMADGVTLPRIPGIECAGVVDAAPGSDDLKPGQQVVRPVLFAMSFIFDVSYKFDEFISCFCFFVSTPTYQISTFVVPLPSEGAAKLYYFIPGGDDG
jgi:hypothetical protein